MATDVVQRGKLDLTRAPWEQWSADMVKLAKQTVLRDAKSEAEVYFCLALADSLGLNPIANEVYFIRRKGRDGDGGGVVPYIGREGLVKLAAERRGYFEADTVRARDEFEIVRAEDGARTCRHRYGKHTERGEIIGAYAFLFVPGQSPAFFYAPLEDYLPTFDQEWKMAKSPWGNQRSAMIEKCAMIGAGRQRLNLSGVLVDAEVERVQSQAIAGEAVEEGEFDIDSLDADDELKGRLAHAVAVVNTHAPLTWTAAKLQLVLTGRTGLELDQIVAGIEREADLLSSQHVEAAPGPSEGDAGSSASGGDEPAEGVTDAQVVDEEHVAALQFRLDKLRERIEATSDEEELGELSAEYDAVEAEIAAAVDPSQLQLDER